MDEIFTIFLDFLQVYGLPPAFLLPAVLAVVCWKFWDNAPAVSYVCLVLSTVITGALTERSCSNYSIELKPVPEGSTLWGGVDKATGEAVSVSATLLRNGKPQGEPKKVDALKLGDRKLKAELHRNRHSDREESMLIKMETHDQGYVPFDDLDPSLRKSISAGTHIPSAISYTSAVRNTGESVRASEDSVTRNEFESLGITVIGWSFDEDKTDQVDLDGVELLVPLKGGVKRALVTRSTALEIPERKLVIGLLSLDLTDYIRRHAVFVLLKYR